MLRVSCAPMLLVAAACAPAVELDLDERNPAVGLQVEFDPAAAVVPFPNDLLRVDGRLALPPQCDEPESSAAVRELALNALDGFGVFKPALTFTTTAPVDLGSAFGTVFLFPMVVDGVPVDPATADPVPLWTFAGEAVRWGAGCASFAPVDNLTLVPAVPLRDATTYAVAVLDGLAAVGGEAFGVTPTWALVRQVEPPVLIVEEASGPRVVANRTPFDPTEPEGLATLVGLDQLWRGHEKTLSFLDVALAGAGAPVARAEILLAWAFTTQTITAPLDPARAGPAAELATLSADTTALDELAGGAAVPAFLEATLGAGACTALPCAAVGAVISGTFAAPSFQEQRPNPAGLSRRVPGAWSDPLAPSHTGNETVPLIAVVPAGAPPPDGWPVVVFGHGLAGNKGQLLAFAPQLAAAGIASVAIDWVAHGSRAVRVDNRDVVGCGGSPTPTSAPHCFAPLLGADLTVTRDNLRQSVLDQLKLLRVLAACADGACPLLPIDPERLGYVGQSLGALIGGVVAAAAPGLRAAVLNVGGAGWVDVFTETDRVEIRCPIIDALLDAGLIAGDTRDRWGGDNPGALCLGDAWRSDPGFLQFQGLARWLLDPADGANFALRLAVSRRPVLLQEVIGDPVVPNLATRQLGTLLGLAPQRAARAVTLPPPPTAAVLADGGAWLRYGDAPDNAYQNGSLLAPAPGLAGALGTAQMQADAIAFLADKL